MAPPSAWRRRSRSQRSRAATPAARRSAVRRREALCAAAALSLGLLLALGGCGGASRHRARAGSSANAVPAPSGPAFGISEDNADLLWPPGAQAPAAAAPFLAARRDLSALHPRYIRLLVDWAALQPSPGEAPDLSAPQSGCARDTGPCGRYPGLAGDLAAIAAAQRAAHAEGRPPPEPVVDILDTPGWAASPPHGCERAGTPPGARTPARSALPSYERLIGALLALARGEGVALRWWSPWNEPNDPRFLSPQREACGSGASPAAPAAYAALAIAMSEELHAQAPSAQMLLGELGGYASSSAHRLGIADFVAALPAQAICLSATWSVHSYAGRAPGAATQDPVRLLERALAARGGCAARAQIWVTESGAGAAEPGRPREGGRAEERGACTALAAQVLGWRADPRVGAIFQYEFRDDPAYPVGLASADLAALTSTYRMWSALQREAGRSEAPSAGALCPPG